MICSCHTFRRWIATPRRSRWAESTWRSARANTTTRPWCEYTNTRHFHAASVLYSCSHKMKCRCMCLCILLYKLHHDRLKTIIKTNVNALVLISLFWLRQQSEPPIKEVRSWSLFKRCQVKMIFDEEALESKDKSGNTVCLWDDAK